jgi:hypothetical protein
MPYCTASWLSNAEMKKISMPESVRYGNKVTQSGTGIIRYRTEMMDAGIAMSAGSAFRYRTEIMDTGIAMSAASALMMMPTSYEVK